MAPSSATGLETKLKRRSNSYESECVIGEPMNYNTSASSTLAQQQVEQHSEMEEVKMNEVGMVMLPSDFDPRLRSSLNL